MTITEAETNRYYKTFAASHGSEYISHVSIKEADQGCELHMGFEGKAKSTSAKILNALDGMDDERRY